MDPVDPMPAWEKGMLLAELTEETVDALLAAAGPQVEIPLIMAEIRLMGGALGRPADGAERGRRAASGAYSVLVLGPAVPELAEVVPAVGKGVLGALMPWAAPEYDDQLPRRRHRARRRCSAPTRPETYQRLLGGQAHRRPGRASSPSATPSDDRRPDPRVLLTSTVSQDPDGDGRRSPRSLGEQDAGVADALRVQPLLDRAQHLDAERADLALHPGAVVGADGVVVGERAAGAQQRVGRRPLGGEPLLDRQRRRRGRPAR